mmetsp:Transcript_27755/g.86157  ORF Transcript_27755/g.86157 Transcript_27755/m.86157 type:complete len:320 (-) Transcript_27755:1091-2050(-)
MTPERRLLAPDLVRPRAQRRAPVRRGPRVLVRHDEVPADVQRPFNLREGEDAAEELMPPETEDVHVGVAPVEAQRVERGLLLEILAARRVAASERVARRAQLQAAAVLGPRRVSRRDRVSDDNAVADARALGLQGFQLRERRLRVGVREARKRRRGRVSQQTRVVRVSPGRREEGRERDVQVLDLRGRVLVVVVVELFRGHDEVVRHVEVAFPQLELLERVDDVLEVVAAVEDVEAPALRQEALVVLSRQDRLVEEVRADREYARPLLLLGLRGLAAKVQPPRVDRALAGILEDRVEDGARAARVLGGLGLVEREPEVH